MRRARNQCCGVHLYILVVDGSFIVVLLNRFLLFVDGRNVDNASQVTDISGAECMG